MISMAYDNDTGYGDLVMGANGIEIDASLRTAAEVLLLTDRTADSADEITDGTDDPRGFWADCLDPLGRRLGSKIWLLAQAKATPTTRRRAQSYALAALAPWIDQGVCERIEVPQVLLTGRPEVVAIEVKVFRGVLGSAPQWESYWIAAPLAVLGGIT